MCVCVECTTLVGHFVARTQDRRVMKRKGKIEDMHKRIQRGEEEGGLTYRGRQVER